MWLQDHDTDPLTNEKIPLCKPTTNKCLREAIDAFLQTVRRAQRLDNNQQYQIGFYTAPHPSIIEIIRNTSIDAKCRMAIREYGSVQGMADILVKKKGETSFEEKERVVSLLSSLLTVMKVEFSEMVKASGVMSILLDYLKDLLGNNLCHN